MMRLSAFLCRTLVSSRILPLGSWRSTITDKPTRHSFPFFPFLGPSLFSFALMYARSPLVSARSASTSLSASSKSTSSSLVLGRLPALSASTFASTSQLNQRRSYTTSHSSSPSSLPRQQSLFAVGHSRTLVLPPSTISHLTRLVQGRTFASPPPPLSETEGKSPLTKEVVSELLAADAKDKKASADKEKKEVGAVKKSMWDKVKHEAKHYWESSKLLAHEVRISWKLQKKVLKGGTLTRREQRQVSFLPER